MKEKPAADGGKLGKELFGLFTVFCGLLVILSLATFDSRDPWLNHVVSGVSRIHNKAGLFGAYLAGLLYDMIGFAAWVVPVFFCIAGARRILSLQEWAWWRWIGFMLLALCLSLAGAARDLDMSGFFARSPLPPGSGNISAHGGGIVGHLLYTGMVGWLSSTGTLMIWLFALLLSVQMITGVSWLTLLKNAGASLWAGATGLARKAADSASEARSRRNPDIAAAKPSAASSAGRLDAADALRIEPVEPLPSLPAAETPRTDIKALSPEDINAGAERPELFRQTPGTGAVSTPQPASSLMDTLPLSMPDAAAFSASRSSPEAAPLLLHLSPEDTAQSMVSVPMPDNPLSLSPRKDDPHKPAPADEDDLPPWVRDFEEDALGMGDGRTLSEPFRMPSASPQPENKGRDAAFSAFSPSGENNDPLPAMDSAPCLTLTREDDPAGASAHERPENGEGGSEPEAPKRSALSFEEDEEDSAEEVQPEHATLSLTLSAVEKKQEAPRIPHEDSDHDSDRESGNVDAGYAGEIRIAETPVVTPASGGGAGPVAAAFRSALGLIKKPARAPLPPLDLLEAVPASVGGMPRSMLEAKGRSLMTCLNDFGIQGELVGITPGPVVTMFEVRPAPGVRVSRIANLSDDLALALKAVAVRIQAPVPGTDTVGIEIPNDVRETVCLKELLGSRLFQDAKSLLTLALGKDIAGEPAVADLASMPHLLVAGATGAGKSVGINSIILSLIYKARPEEVKLLLVDPKRVEMAIYADLPHLVHPVVTEMQLAKNALEWAVTEMERRYNAIAKASVRNIADYNAKVAAFGDSPPPGLEDLEVMPYLVIVIDELADLMLVAAKEVETSIVRLAQLARAAGIHLILATQRPSVDVVTGLIKANFPCRIAFQVTSKHDSRTILDTVGAEHLLGKGDMLFKPGGGKFRRMHGAFVSDKNVNAVVDYWRSRQKPDYQVDFTDWGQDGGNGVLTGDNGGGGDIASDPIYNEAVEFVRQQGKASISLIQRKFRIGFNKAARFVEQMEQDGIIGPADGSRPRLVIR